MGGIALAIGAAWLAIFMVRLANGGAPNWLDTWWLLVGGISFVAPVSLASGAAVGFGVECIM